jgi:hypothetical protein
MQNKRLLCSCLIYENTKILFGKLTLQAFSEYSARFFSVITLHTALTNVFYKRNSLEMMRNNAMTDMVEGFNLLRNTGQTSTALANALRLEKSRSLFLFNKVSLAQVSSVVIALEYQGWSLLNFRREQFGTD